MTNQLNGNEASNPYSDNAQYNFGKILCTDLSRLEEEKEVNLLNGNSLLSDLLPTTEKAVVTVNVATPTPDIVDPIQQKSNLQDYLSGKIETVYVAEKGRKTIKCALDCPSKNQETMEAIIEAFSKAKATKRPVFVRDTTLVGYVLKVNPAGSIQNVVHLTHDGKSYRRTIAPLSIIGYSNSPKDGMLIEQARTKALEIIANIRKVETIYEFIETGFTLKHLLEQYMQLDLADNTKTDYKQTISFYLQDWMSFKITDISRQMIVERFEQIRDYGVFGGKATHSQASKCFRVLSAMFNYAIGYDHLESNACEVLKQRRIKKFTKAKESFLTKREGRKLLDFIGESRDSQLLAIRMYLQTGLRKEECLGLKWKDIQDIDGIQCIVLDPSRTKNNHIHIIPITETMQDILDKSMSQKGEDNYIFTKKDNTSRIGAMRYAIRNITEQVGIPYVTVHDLRRSFASCADTAGIEHKRIKQMMNHKDKDITERYIQRLHNEALTQLRNEFAKVEY
jgi:integrase